MAENAIAHFFERNQVGGYAWRGIILSPASWPMRATSFAFAQQAVTGRPFFTTNAVHTNQQINQAANKWVPEPEQTQPAYGSAVFTAFQKNMYGSRYGGKNAESRQQFKDQQVCIINE